MSGSETRAGASSAEARRTSISITSCRTRVAAHLWWRTTFSFYARVITSQRARGSSKELLTLRLCNTGEGVEIPVPASLALPSGFKHHLRSGVGWGSDLIVDGLQM